tara:strand:- start:762 stop:1886 length:1125 start_codon:yes stop_codon:yes gene_type:complete
MKKIASLLGLGLLVFILFNFANSTENKESPKKPKNIIILIGDGMGISQLSSAYYFKEDEDKEPNFSRMPIVGLSRTSSAKEKITDSAAGATAISCGEKTYNGAIAVDVNGEDLQTILELLAQRDYSTGLVASSSITHATPASFFAHAKSRHMAKEIAAQMPDSEVDFFAGGGLEYFYDESAGINVIDILHKKGFVTGTDCLLKAEKLEKEKKYGFLLAKDGMPKMSKGRGDFLSNATDLALNYFELQEKPFFLMVEASQIDWGGHANDADYVISETLDFDKMLGLVLDFAQKDSNTLVIVTADHETGGFTLAAKEKKVPFQGTQRDYKEIGPRFSTGGHSAAMVPVLAFGPGSESFSGIYQNTEIHAKLLEILK